MSDTLLDTIFAHGMDVRRRRVFLHAPMETGSSDEDAVRDLGAMERVVRALLYLDKTTGPIELWINSPGGLVVEMFGLYDVIQTLDNEVDTVGFGWVCSAAGLILACGKRRYVTPNCFFMSHLSAGDVSGDLLTLEAQVQFDRRLHDRWAALMARHTKHARKWWTEIHEGKTRELWLDAKEMLRHGIADEIWPPPDDEGDE